MVPLTDVRALPLCWALIRTAVLVWADAVAGIAATAARLSRMAPSLREDLVISLPFGDRGFVTRNDARRPGRFRDRGMARGIPCRRCAARLLFVPCDRPRLDRGRHLREREAHAVPRWLTAGDG